MSNSFMKQVEKKQEVKEIKTMSLLDQLRVAVDEKAVVVSLTMVHNGAAIIRMVDSTTGKAIDLVARKEEK